MRLNSLAIAHSGCMMMICGEIWDQKFEQLLTLFLWWWFVKKYEIKVEQLFTLVVWWWFVEKYVIKKLRNCSVWLYGDELWNMRWKSWAIAHSACMMMICGEIWDQNVEQLLIVVEWWWFVEKYEIKKLRNCSVWLYGDDLGNMRWKSWAIPHSCCMMIICGEICDQKVHQLLTLVVWWLFLRNMRLKVEELLSLVVWWWFVEYEMKKLSNLLLWLYDDDLWRNMRLTSWRIAHSGCMMLICREIWD